MKISPITYRNTNINFKAGKTQIYSDFDGTYFPFHQNILRETSTHPDVVRMQTMQSQMADFINGKPEKLSLVITTGRSKAEMQHLLNNIGKNKIFFFSPEYFIFRDGSEKCEIQKSEDYITLHKSEETKPFMPIEELREKIIGIIKGVEPSTVIFEGKINKIEEDYKEESIESEYKKTNTQNKLYSSLNFEDSGLVEIAFPFHFKTFRLVENEIRKWVEENSLPLEVKSEELDSNYMLPSQVDIRAPYTCEKGYSIILKPKKNNTNVNKLLQPKEAIKTIIEKNSNDLVVVTGDGSNDESMLNPLNYLDLYGIEIDWSKPIDEILENEEVIEALKKLPLVPIVAGNGKSLKNILEMKSILDKKKIRLIQHAKDPEKELLAKVKRGMHEYSDRNSKYKFGLGKKLYTEIIG